MNNLRVMPVENGFIVVEDDRMMDGSRGKEHVFISAKDLGDFVGKYYSTKTFREPEYLHPATDE